MYARFITYQVKPWVTEDHASAMYDEMHSIMQPLPGFKGLSLMLNSDIHRALSISYWDDQSCAAEAGLVLLPLLMTRAAEFVDHPPEVAGFELVRHTDVAGLIGVW